MLNEDSGFRIQGSGIRIQGKNPLPPTPLPLAPLHLSPKIKEEILKWNMRLW